MFLLSSLLLSLSLSALTPTFFLFSGQCPSHIFMLAPVFLIHFALFIWGIWLTVVTRDVPSQFNTSKPVGVFTYNASVSLLLYAVLANNVFVRLPSTTQAVFVYLSLCYVATSAAFILFLPLIVSVMMAMRRARRFPVTTTLDTRVSLVTQALLSPRYLCQTRQSTNPLDDLFTAFTQKQEENSKQEAVVKLRQQELKCAEDRLWETRHALSSLLAELLLRHPGQAQAIISESSNSRSVAEALSNSLIVHLIGN